LVSRGDTASLMVLLGRHGVEYLGTKWNLGPCDHT
jgi:hypothetical protein